MQIQKTTDLGNLFSKIIAGLGNKKEEDKKKVVDPAKKDEKKLPADWDEDLERANREQEAINKGEFASVNVEVKVAGFDDCGCKQKQPCKGCQPKVNKSFKC